MKALAVVGLLLASLVAQADPRPYPMPVPPARPGYPVPVPAPAPQPEELSLFTPVNLRLHGEEARYTPVGAYLNLPPGTTLNSVVLVVSSREGRGMVSVMLNGQMLTERYVGARLEVIQVPVNQPLYNANDLALSTRGHVFVSQIGATYYGTYVNPNPVPPAQPVGPACELVGYGPYNGYNWNFRVRVNGAIMEADDNLDNALNKLQQLASARVCYVAAPQACTLHGYGAYRGYNWNYRIELGMSGIIEGNDNLEGLFGVSRRLQNAGLCVPTATAQCMLLPAGAYRGYNWTHRVSIGDRVVDAFDNLGQATQRMNELRRAGFCF